MPHRPDARRTGSVVTGLLRRGASGGGRLLAAGARTGLERARGRLARAQPGTGRPLALIGRVWTGGDAEPVDGIVLLDAAGVVLALGTGVDVPAGARRVGGPEHWIGPGVIDHHVLGGPPDGAGGVLGAREFGASVAAARARRTGHGVPAAGQVRASSGPVLAVGRPGGEDEHSARVAVDGPARARAVVHRLAALGSDVIAVDLDDVRGLDPATVRAVVDTAHGSGLVVVARATSVAAVVRALDCGVDELAAVPTERLPDPLIARTAAAGVALVSGLQASFSAGRGPDAARNAADLVQAGATLRYGSAGAGRAVDPRELDRLADTGLGRLGALRAATAAGPGVRLRSGRLVVGAAASLVVLPADPLVEVGAWCAPSLVLADGRALDASDGTSVG